MEETIRNIASVQTGFYFPSEKDWDTNYLQARFFDNFWDLKEELIPEIKSENIQEKHLLNDWDILFSAKGNRNFATVYKKEYWKSVASSTFFVIKITNKNIIPDYLAILLNESQKTGYFKNRFSGWTIQSIPKTVLENFKIDIPPIAKQEKIIKLYNLYKDELKIYEKIKEKKEILINKIILKSNK